MDYNLQKNQNEETDLSFHSQSHYVCQHCLSTAVNSTMVKLIVKLADRFF